MSKVRDVRQDITSLETEVQLLERARSDSWEVIIWSRQFNLGGLRQ